MIKPPLKRFPQFYEGDKLTLSMEEFYALMENSFIVEEKLDGTLIVKEHGDFLLMLEDMKYVHTVYYTKLPGRYILVDVLNEDRTSRLPLCIRNSISMETGYPLPPLIGNFDSTFRGGPVQTLLGLQKLCNNSFSEWGDVTPEGFVVKSERILTLGGKYSRLDLTGEARYTKDVMNRIVGYQW